MAYFGVDKDVRVNELNMKFRNFLRSKGFVDTRGMAQIFKQMDKNDSKSLDRQEFQYAMGKLG